MVRAELNWVPELTQRIVLHCNIGMHAVWLDRDPRGPALCLQTARKFELDLGALNSNDEDLDSLRAN